MVPVPSAHFEIELTVRGPGFVPVEDLVVLAVAGIFQTVEVLEY